MYKKKRLIFDTHQSGVDYISFFTRPIDSDDQLKGITHNANIIAMTIVTMKINYLCCSQKSHYRNNNRTRHSQLCFVLYQWGSCFGGRSRLFDW